MSLNTIASGNLAMPGSSTPQTVIIASGSGSPTIYVVQLDLVHLPAANTVEVIVKLTNGVGGTDNIFDQAVVGPAASPTIIEIGPHGSFDQGVEIEAIQSAGSSTFNIPYALFSIT